MIDRVHGRLREIRGAQNVFYPHRDEPTFTVTPSRGPAVGIEPGGPPTIQDRARNNQSVRVRREVAHLALRPLLRHAALTRHDPRSRSPIARSRRPHPKEVGSHASDQFPNRRSHNHTIRSATTPAWLAVREKHVTVDPAPQVTDASHAPGNQVRARGVIVPCRRRTRPRKSDDPAVHD
jgi:hypothetical protein